MKNDNIFNIITEKRTKWGIQLDRNDKRLTDGGFQFTPYEHTTDMTLALFIAASSIRGANGEYDARATRGTNALRACLAACQCAKAYGGRVTDTVAAVLARDDVRAVMTRTDEAESAYIVARAAFTAADRQYKARAELLSIAGLASSEKDKNELDAIAALKSEMDEARQAFTTAKRAENALNWQVIRSYFPYFTNANK